MLYAPKLTDYDMPELSEGSIDPLGLAPLSARLAERLTPGIRERTMHPRFMTAMTVGAVVCEYFPEDKVAADEQSSPWQVYEWYAVLGMVHRSRKSNQPEAIRGLPGREKAATALKTQPVYLSAANYLKVPSVFGFHGVYKGLARELNILDGMKCNDVGFDLLLALEDEKNLKGFHEGKGNGGSWCDILRQAVRDGLAKGFTNRSLAWQGWDFFFNYLLPYEAGPKESAILWQALLGDPNGPRAILLQQMVTEEGQSVWKKCNIDQKGSERIFHEWLRNRVNGEIVSILDAIDAYESFSRLIQDAFQDLLLGASEPKPVAANVLSNLGGVKHAYQQLHRAYDQAIDRLSLFHEDGIFTDTFADLITPTTVEEFVALLLEFHHRNQARKPPAGKASWFDHFEDGRVMTRAEYRYRSPSQMNDSYVGLYRTGSLWSMASDLACVS